MRLPQFSTTRPVCDTHTMASFRRGVINNLSVGFVVVTLHLSMMMLMLSLLTTIIIAGVAAQSSTKPTQALRFCAGSDVAMSLCMDMARLAQQQSSGPFSRKKREADPRWPNDRDRTQGGGGNAYDQNRNFGGNYFYGSSNNNPVRTDMPATENAGRARNPPPAFSSNDQNKNLLVQQRQYSSNNNQYNNNNANGNSYSNNNQQSSSGAYGSGGAFDSSMSFGTQIQCVRATDNYDCMKLIGDPDSQRRYADVDPDLFAHAVLLGPAEAYIAVQYYGMTPIAVELVPESGSATPNIAGLPQPFLARVVAVTTGDIQSINDMRGRQFCYAKANDTLGWFLPNAVLERQGVLSPPNACNSTYLDMVAGSSGGACVPNTWQDYYQGPDGAQQRLQAQLCQCQGVSCNIGNRFQYPVYTDAIRCLVSDPNKDVAFTTDVAIRDAYTMGIWPSPNNNNNGQPVFFPNNNNNINNINNNQNNYNNILPNNNNQNNYNNIPPNNNNNYNNNQNNANNQRQQQQDQKRLLARSNFHLVCPTPNTATQRTYADLDDDDVCNWGQLPTRVWLASQRLDRATILDLQSHIGRIFDGSASRGRTDPWFMQYFSPDYPRLSQNEPQRKRAVGLQKLDGPQQNDPRSLLQQYAGLAYPLLLEDDFTTCSDRFKSGKIKWCTTSQVEMEKCRIMMQAFQTIQMQPSLDCVRASSPRQCMQNIDSEMADLAVFDAADAYRGYFWYYLTPLMQERYGNEDSLFSVAVVKTGNSNGGGYNSGGPPPPPQGGPGPNNNNNNYNNGGSGGYGAPPVVINSLSDLQDKRICSSGYGDAAGWIEPMATLKNFDIINSWNSWDFKDFGESADRMFGASCVPGANQDDSNPGHTGSSKLCQQCSTDSTARCSRNADEIYSGQDGALNCLRDGAGDVAFMAHTGLLEINSDEMNNYQLLCPGIGPRGSSNWQGVTTAPLMSYQSCNWGRVPASFVMTSPKKDPYVRQIMIEYLMKAQEVFGQNPYVPGWQMGGGGGGGGGGYVPPGVGVGPGPVQTGGYGGGGGSPFGARYGGGGLRGQVPPDVLMSLYPGITSNSFMMFGPRNRTDNYARRNRARLAASVQQQQSSFLYGDGQFTVVPNNATYYGLFSIGATELVPLPQPAMMPAYIDADFHNDMILVDWDLHRNGGMTLLLRNSRWIMLSVLVFVGLTVRRFSDFL